MSRADRITDRCLIGAMLLAAIVLALTFHDYRSDIALACARASNGTDQAIADCYQVRGLPCPADICPR